MRNHTFNGLKVLEMGPLRLSKCDLYKTFPISFQLKRSHFIFGQKGLVKVAFNSPFRNLKGPISKTFKVSKV